MHTTPLSTRTRSQIRDFMHVHNSKHAKHIKRHVSLQESILIPGNLAPAAELDVVALRTSVQEIKRLAATLTPPECHTMAVHFLLQYASHQTSAIAGCVASIRVGKLGGYLTIMFCSKSN